jgi:hypothetical protein
VSWGRLTEPWVDVTTNSWGISVWPLLTQPAGIDPVALTYDMVAAEAGVPSFVAAGNGGPGYTTVVTPASSYLSITVGAVADFEYMASYGVSNPGSYGSSSYFTARGPAPIGVPKPDIVAVGQFAFAAGRVVGALAAGDVIVEPWETVSLYGGTSMATPMAAGAAALAVQALKESLSQWPPQGYPLMLKSLVMATASDLGLPPSTQGAGMVNAYLAARAVLTGEMPPLAYSPSSAGQLGEAWLLEPPSPLPGSAAAWAAARDIALVTLEVEGGEPGHARVVALVEEWRVEARETVDFKSLPAQAVLLREELDPSELEGVDLLVIQAYIPYHVFDSEGRGRASPEWRGVKAVGLKVKYWVDLDYDGSVDPGEEALIAEGGWSGNGGLLEVGYPSERMAVVDEWLREAMGVDPEGLRRLVAVELVVYGNEWGVLQAEGGVGEAGLRVSAYMWREWPGASASYSGGVVRVELPAPPQGWRVGYVKLEWAGGEVRVPVVVHAVAEVEGWMARVDAYVRPLHNYWWWYEDGDWRLFFLRVDGPALIVVEARWPYVRGQETHASNIDALVYGPRYAWAPEEGGLNPAPAPARLAAELTNAPYGRLLFFWDLKPGLLRLVAPVPEGSWLLALLIHAIQVSGLGFEEPLTISVYKVSVGLEPGELEPGTQEITVALTGLYPLDAVLDTGSRVQGIFEAVKHPVGEWSEPLGLAAVVDSTTPVVHGWGLVATASVTVEILEDLRGGGAALALTFPTLRESPSLSIGDNVSGSVLYLNESTVTVFIAVG